MSFFPTSPLYAGIDVNDCNTYVAYLSKGRKGWEVVSLKTFSSDAAVHLIENSVGVSTIPSRETLVRTLELHIKEKDLKAALDFQIEPLLPYPTDKAIIQSQMIEKKAHKTRVTAFSIRHDHIQTHLDYLSQKKLEPEKVTCVPYALATLTTLFPPTTSSQFLVHSGEKEVTCILVKQGKLLAARAFDHSRHLGTEVQKTILSFSSTHKNEMFETILFLGEEGLEIQEATGKPICFPTLPLLSLSKEDLITYGLAIGSALAAKGIDFRQKRFSYPHRWKHLKKPLFVSATLFTFLIASLFTFGHIASKRQKQTIKEAYLFLCQVEGKSINTFDCPTTPHGYLASLNRLEDEVRLRPDTFPLLPKTPTVKEFLAWLCTQQGIKIDFFHYFMVKRPEFSHKKEHYKVRIELEFSANDIEAANLLHDKLVSSNPLIDVKEEVQWTAGKGKYRTCFYLKDKTRYS